MLYTVVLEIAKSEAAGWVQEGLAVDSEVALAAFVALAAEAP